MQKVDVGQTSNRFERDMKFTRNYFVQETWRHAWEICNRYRC